MQTTLLSNWGMEQPQITNPAGTNPDNGEGSGGQRLTHYKNTILKRIQAAEKTPVNGNK